MYVSEDFFTEKAVKIHKTKMGGLNASTDQQRRTAQTGKTTETRFKITILRKSIVGSQTKNFKSLSTLNARR